MNILSKLLVVVLLFSAVISAEEVNNADEDRSAMQNALLNTLPVQGRMVSAPEEALEVPDGAVEVCEGGDNWVSLVSKQGLGCDKACQSQGMRCRRSYHDVPGSCARQPWELGCGQLKEHTTDFCGCSKETFYQGELFFEHPKTRETPPLKVCRKGKNWATLVFHDSSGCKAACESVGLVCHKSFDDLELECGPQADPEFELACENDLAHKSDFCACTEDGSAKGLPPSVTAPWKPFK